MVDFLQNLRNSTNEKQRKGMTKKNQTTACHPANQKSNVKAGHQKKRAKQKKKASSPNHKRNQLPTVEGTRLPLQDAIKKLNSHIEMLSKNQAHLIISQKKTSDMIEHQIAVLDRVLVHFNISPKLSKISS